MFTPRFEYGQEIGYYSPQRREVTSHSGMPPRPRPEGLDLNMRKTKTFQSKRHVYDTDKAEKISDRYFGEYGDPAGYEESLYKTKAGLYFIAGVGGADSPYPEADIKPVSAKEAKAFK